MISLRTALILTGCALLLSKSAIGQSWTQLAPSGAPPVPRTDASAVYDPSSNRMVVFGGNPVGCSFAASLNDTWLLTNANGLGGTPQWTQVSPTGGPPPVRRRHTAVYKAATNRMIVFGGDPVGCAVSKYNDVWVLQNANAVSGTPAWVQLSPTGGPPPARSDNAVAYDPTSNRMTIFGGFGPAGNLSDVWVLTNADGTGGAPQWIQLSPTGGPPAGTELNAYVYDGSSNRMTVAGGGTCCSAVTPTYDVWVLTNANGLGGTPQWIQLSPSGIPPTPRMGFEAVYDAANNRMITFAGGTSTGQTNEVWVLTNANGLGGAPQFIQLSPAGPAPLPRGGIVAEPTATYDASTNRITIFGGNTSSGVVNDTWVLTNANGIAADTQGPITSSVVAAPNPVAIGNGITLTATVDDSTTGGSSIASAQYNINGGAFQPMAAADGSFDEVTENVTASVPPFTVTGVYSICVQGVDAPGNVGPTACTPLPVYDPTDGFVTGGGSISSSAGADLANPSAAGPATFGFVSKYLRGANTPSGSLVFQFHAGNLDFKSTSMEWLVVTGEPRAQFHGTGTVNGSLTCQFQVDAWDNSFQPGNLDAFGIKIYSCGSGQDRYSIPATPLANGSIIIHK